jgi:hypothetical protein
LIPPEAMMSQVLSSAKLWVIFGKILYISIVHQIHELQRAKWSRTNLYTYRSELDGKKQAQYVFVLKQKT